MAKKFTKLFLGDVVQNAGGKAFRKLTTEEPQDETIVGAWKLDKVMTDLTIFDISVKFKTDHSAYVGDEFYRLYTEYSSDDGYQGYGLISGYSLHCGLFDFGEMVVPNITIEILEDVADANDRNTLLTWLKANATKQ